MIGVKCWIFKGEVFDKAEVELSAAEAEKGAVAEKPAADKAPTDKAPEKAPEVAPV